MKFSEFFTSKDNIQLDKKTLVTLRWLALAGPRGRFMRFLVTQIIKKKGKWNDTTTSPKIRQVLQHWGYKLTKKDYDTEIKRRRRKTKKK